MIKLPLTVLLTLLSSVGFVAVGQAVTGVPVTATTATLPSTNPITIAPPTNVQLAQAEVPLATLMSDGQAGYTRECQSCHGDQGQGGFGERLVDSPIVASVGGVINQILLGAEVHGMPPFRRLSDVQIASIATFVRNSWGNAFGPIQPTVVADIRATAGPAE